MAGLGFGELMLILIIVVVVFGATKLPQLGDGLGKAIRNFKRSVNGANGIEVAPKKAAPGTLEDGAAPAAKDKA